MTGRTCRPRHSSAPRRCARTAWWTTQCTATQHSTSRLWSPVTVSSSSMCHTWATASVPWMSNQSWCWAVPTRWCCSTSARTRSWPGPSCWTWRCWQICASVWASAPTSTHSRRTSTPCCRCSTWHPLPGAACAARQPGGQRVLLPPQLHGEYPHGLRGTLAAEPQASGAQDGVPWPQGSWACGCHLCLARKDQCPPPPVAILVTPMGTCRPSHPRCPPPKAMAIQLRHNSCPHCSSEPNPSRPPKIIKLVPLSKKKKFYTANQ